MSPNFILAGILVISLFVNIVLLYVSTHPKKNPDTEDANRYRWLRNQPSETNKVVIDIVMWDDIGEGEAIRGSELDTCVDIEMQYPSK